MNMEERLRPGPECELGCELVADVARRFGEVRLRLTGASMMPAVRPGDVITAQRCRMRTHLSRKRTLWGGLYW